MCAWPNEHKSELAVRICEQRYHPAKNRSERGASRPKSGEKLMPIGQFPYKITDTSKFFIYLDKFDWSRGKQVRSVKKVYVSDIGFYSLKGFRFSENLGRIAENLVAIELFRRKTFDPAVEIYYWRDYQDHEVCAQPNESSPDLRGGSASRAPFLLKNEKSMNCKKMWIVRINWRNP